MFKNKSLIAICLSRQIVFIITLLVSLYAFAQHPNADSTRVHKLNEVEVNALQLRPIYSSLPLQLHTQKEFLSLNAVNVADVANTFSGVTLKDYGGIGGMKTVSVRGMDTHYTGVSYDGVMMSNIQSGQIDLGRFSLDNIAEVSLFNGHPTDIFQSARLFSCGSVLALKTRLPEYDDGKSFSGKVYVRAGSFGMFNPGFLLAKNMSRKWAFNVSADGLTAHGRYSFIQNYGTSATDVSEVLKRTNTDVHALRSEINGVYRFSAKEFILLKTNLFLSERGLPGSITFYNQAASKSRLADRAVFTQVQYQNRRSNRYQYQFAGRFNNAYSKFTDRDPKYSQTNGLLSDEYTQNEYYLSASLTGNITEGLVLSGAADWWYNQLDITSNVNFEDFQYPTRHTGMGNIALKYFTERFTLGGNLLYTLTREAVKSGESAPDRSKFSPAVNVSYRLFEDKEYRVRAFYKNIYRLPTFNDLYYQNMGNPRLRPENAQLIDLGFTFMENNIGALSEISFTADGYYNRVMDKIIMMPIDGFHWSMVNRGKVNIIGVDAALKAVYKLGKKSTLNLRSNYSFQSAKDATDGSDNYGEQIPYIPMHFGSASLSYRYGVWEAGYSALFSGVRWIGQMTNPRNKMEPYATHSLFASTQYKRWQLNAELINLLNTQYEVARFYPMPRRNYRISLIMNF